MDLIIFSFYITLLIVYLYNEIKNNRNKIDQMSHVMRTLSNINIDISDTDEVLRYTERLLYDYNEENDLIIYTLLLYCLKTDMKSNVIHLCDRYVDITKVRERREYMLLNIERYGY